MNLCAGPTPAYTLVQPETVHAFLDEVLAAGPLVVEAPHSLGYQFRGNPEEFPPDGYGHLLEQLELFSRFFSGLDCLADYHQTQFSMRVQGKQRFANGDIWGDLPPRSDPQNKLLDVDELRHYDIELNPAPDQPANEVHVEKAAVGPQPSDHPKGKLAQHQSQKGSGLIGIRAVARTKNSSQVVPCLPDEAKQLVMALAASLFRIVALVGPVLLPKDGDNMGIQVQRQGFELFKSGAPHVEQARVYLGNLNGRMDRDFIQKSANRALDRKFPEFRNLLKYLIPHQLHHMTGPEYSEHQRIQHAHTHMRWGVVRVAPITDAHRLQVLAQLAFCKEPSDQTRTAKSGQILPGELLLRSQILFFLLRLCYIYIHFLSASFSGSLGKRILPEKEAFLLNIM